jgi:uncharacterized protein (DUF952 family)
MIYHLAKRSVWEASVADGMYRGAEADRADGFLHFSTAGQIEESAWKHRRGESDLVLLCVDESRLGEELAWEASRGGALFPHLYGPLPHTAVTAALPLPLGPDGRHVFPLLDSSG